MTAWSPHALKPASEQSVGEFATLSVRGEPGAGSVRPAPAFGVIRRPAPAISLT
jgi:hypothetical protein